MAMDAQKGTNIYPVKVHYYDKSKKPWFTTRWVFKNSFGKWKCEEPPE